MESENLYFGDVENCESVYLADLAHLLSEWGTPDEEAFRDL